MAELPYNKEVREGVWTTGLYDVALDPGICCLSFLLPCWQYGKNSQRLGGRSVPDALSFCLLGPFWWLVSYSSRRRLKRKYDLPTEPFGDLAVACLCCCCALSQEARELHARKEAALAIKFDTMRAPAEQIMQEGTH